jgi:hypothetical protein
MELYMLQRPPAKNAKKLLFLRRRRGARCEVRRGGEILENPKKNLTLILTISNYIK